jgi:multidrug efflux pump
MNHEFQPGDKTPSDGQRPGDASKLRSSDLRGGDRAPEDGAATPPRTPIESSVPLNESGVNFSAPFINRPVATFLLSFAIILAGAVGYTLLPVSSLPQVEFPVINVSAGLPGADPETMASAVATPLERQFSRIAGVNEMTSSSGIGSCNITLQFDLNRDVDGAARDVQAAINAARSQLPTNLPSNPNFRKINPADAPILILALTSDTMSVPQLYDAADSILAQKIAQVPGVGQASIGGSSKPAVRIEANPTLLAATGVGLEALRAAVSQVNVNQPTGYLTDDKQRWEVSTSDQLFGAAAYAPLIVATDRGAVSRAAASSGLPTSAGATTTSGTGAASTATAAATAAAKSPFTTPRATTTAQTTALGSRTFGAVRIEDVADVVDSVEDIHTGGLINGKPGILVVVFKSPGANVIQTVDNVLAQLPTLVASMPPAVHVQVALDRTTTIRASVRDVTRTLLLSIVLVILVVFVFLREIRSTLIPSVSVPLSLLGTCGVMYMLGYTLDNLSLMALTISTGFVVDDAIVVIENISRHLEEGRTPYDAAMVGSREIGFTVLSMSVSLIAVFIPLLLMGGIVGRLFREFAVTLSVAILTSLVVSLTTTPMLSAKFLEAHSARKHGRIYKFGERMLDKLTAEYEHGLRWVLRHQVLILFLTIGTLALNVYLFILVPKGFFPQQDTGRMGGQLRGQEDVSFLSMRQKMISLAKIVGKDPGIQNVMVQLGGGGYNARMFISLKPDEEREKNGDSAEAIINRLRPKTANIPGVQLFLQSSQDLNIGGRQTATQYQYALTADTLEELNKWSQLLLKKLQTLPELKDVTTDQQENGLQATLEIDRDTASRLGVTVLAIDATLSDAFGQRQVSTTYMPLNQYHVVMEVAPEYQQDPDALNDIYVKSTNGAEVPLSAVTHYVTKRIPLQVNHQSQMPSATLSFNLATGYSLSDATAAIEQARVDLDVPTTVRGGFAGTAQAFQASLKSEPILILLALTAVYIVLGILYESFIHPLTILSTLPSAGVGALLALLLFKIELSVIAMIGIILLIGIVKKNAIMMIDFALIAEREHGKTPQEAIYEACLLRFRPIMMTTMAAMLGAMPLAFGTGTGSELRRPLGITIVGGLAVSQCLTLFTTPVIYLFFDKLRSRASRTVARVQSSASGSGHIAPQPVAGD